MKRRSEAAATRTDEAARTAEVPPAHTAPLTPRDWIGDGQFPWPPTSSVPDGEPVVACYSILELKAGRTRGDESFLRLLLADCYGTVEARLWTDVESALAVLRPGLYVGVRGRIERYHDERQLNIEQIAPLQVDLDDLVLFLPRSSRAAEVMEAELRALIGSIADASLRQLVLALMGPKTEVGPGFRLAPAAKQHHHAYLGGLLEHTISVARVCDLLASHYGPRIDRDLLLAGALLHDIGKVREIGARAGFPYTDEGKLLGHILLGLQMIAEAAAKIGDLDDSRLLLLQHLVASHQGRYEWQSPREPRTLEALLLHYADDLDAKLNQASVLMAAVEHGWTAYDRSFGRDFLRHRSVSDETPARGPVALDAMTKQSAASSAAKQSPPVDTLDLFES